MATEGEADTAAVAAKTTQAAEATTTAATAAPPAATNGDNSSNKKDNMKRPPRDETPIEDLYDLSQPIPRVDRPNKDEHEKELQVLTDKIEAIKADRQKVQDKIDAAMADPAAKGEMKEKRTKLDELKGKKAALISEKKAMRTQMDQARNEREKLIKDKKDVKSNIKFDTMEDIDKEIRKLERTQETTSMSLNEEKKLIKEMDALKASKKYVDHLKAKDSDLDNVSKQRLSIKEHIQAKDKEIDAVSEDLKEIMDFIKAQNEKDSKKRDAIQSLFKERDSFKKQIAEVIKEKDAIRAEFREKNNAWYNFQRAVRAQKKMQYEEEKKRRDEERAAYEAKLAAEEAKKIPYEEEQALCDYLADYLERTYLNAGGKSEDKEAKKTDAVAADADSPFAGMKAINKRDDEAESYFGKGGGKKKRNRQNKKQANVGAGPFTLSVDSFEQFGLLQLTPPTSIDQVAASVKELREKKEWYKQQERGSVPTAKEIRKANESAAAKLRKSTDTASKKAAAKPKPGNFSLSNDDFVPLGAAGAGQLNESWGQPKPAAESEE